MLLYLTIIYKVMTDKEIEAIESICMNDSRYEKYPRQIQANRYSLNEKDSEECIGLVCERYKMHDIDTEHYILL